MVLNNGNLQGALIVCSVAGKQNRLYKKTIERACHSAFVTIQHPLHYFSLYKVALQPMLASVPTLGAMEIELMLSLNIKPIGWLSKSSSACIYVFQVSPNTPNVGWAPLRTLSQPWPPSALSESASGQSTQGILYSSLSAFCSGAFRGWCSRWQRPCLVHTCLKPPVQCEVWDTSKHSVPLWGLVQRGKDTALVDWVASLPHPHPQFIYMLKPCPPMWLYLETGPLKR